MHPWCVKYSSKLGSAEWNKHVRQNPVLKLFSSPSRRQQSFVRLLEGDTLAAGHVIALLHTSTAACTSERCGSSQPGGKSLHSCFCCFAFFISLHKYFSKTKHRAYVVEVGLGMTSKLEFIELKFVTKKVHKVCISPMLNVTHLKKWHSTYSLW